MNIICSLVRPRRNYNNFYWLKWRREQVLIEIVSCLHSRCAINQAQRTFITFIIPTVPTENYFRCKKQFFTSPAAHPAVAKLICPQFDTRLKFIFLSKKNYFESVCWRLLRTWKVTSWLFIHSLKLRNHSTMSQLWMTRSKSCFVTIYVAGKKPLQIFSIISRNWFFYCPSTLTSSAASKIIIIHSIAFSFRQSPE